MKFEEVLSYLNKNEETRPSLKLGDWGGFAPKNKKEYVELLDALKKNTSVKSFSVVSALGYGGVSMSPYGSYTRQQILNPYPREDRTTQEEKGEGEINITAVFDMLQENKGLTDVSIKYRKIGIEEAKGLSKVLKANTTLTMLDLEGCEIASEAMILLAEGLKDNNALRILILNNNPIGERGMIALMKACSIHKTLTHLSLKGCNMTSAICNHLINSIPVIAVKMLDLTNNDLTSNDLMALFKNIETHPCLKSLSLSFYGSPFSHSVLSSEALDTLFSSITKNKNLQELVLELSDVEHKTAGILTNMLKSNNTLEKFEFKGNLSVGQFQEVAKGLQGSRLKSVVIGQPRIFNDEGPQKSEALKIGFRNLAEAIEQTQHLQSFVFDFGGYDRMQLNMDEIALDQLAAAFGKNQSLERVDIRFSVDLSDHVQECFSEVLGNNKTIQNYHFNPNRNLSLTFLNGLEKSLEKNSKVDSFSILSMLEFLSPVMGNTTPVRCRIKEKLLIRLLSDASLCIDKIKKAILSPEKNEKDLEDLLNKLNQYLENAQEIFSTLLPYWGAEEQKKYLKQRCNLLLEGHIVTGHFEDAVSLVNEKRDLLSDENLKLLGTVLFGIDKTIIPEKPELLKVFCEKCWSLDEVQILLYKNAVYKKEGEQDQKKDEKIYQQEEIKIIPTPLLANIIKKQLLVSKEDLPVKEDLCRLLPYLSPEVLMLLTRTQPLNNLLKLNVNTNNITTLESVNLHGKTAFIQYEPTGIGGPLTVEVLRYCLLSLLKNVATADSLSPTSKNISLAAFLKHASWIRSMVTENYKMFDGLVQEQLNFLAEERVLQIYPENRNNNRFFKPHPSLELLELLVKEIDMLCQLENYNEFPMPEILLKKLEESRFEISALKNFQLKKIANRVLELYQKDKKRFQAK